MTTPVLEVDENKSRKRITWEGITTAANATIKGYALPCAAAFASVQVVGTFGSATVTMQKSNNGTNYVALADTAGAAISKTSAGMSEFATGGAFIRPQISGGTGDDIDVIVVVWEG